MTQKGNSPFNESNYTETNDALNQSIIADIFDQQSSALAAPFR
jgi:hypothetical protein